MKSIVATIISCFLISFANSQVKGDEQMTRKKHFNLSGNGQAVAGYDITSYFNGSPKKGNSSYSYTYKGVIYLFASKKNRELFKANPDKYEPAYGGWCAYAMGAKGEKVEVDPENYKMANSRLFLFYKGFFSNTLDDWNADEKNLNKNADINWGKIYK